MFVIKLETILAMITLNEKNATSRLSRSRKIFYFGLKFSFKNQSWIFKIDFMHNILSFGSLRWFIIQFSDTINRISILRAGALQHERTQIYLWPVGEMKYKQQCTLLSGILVLLFILSSSLRYLSYWSLIYPTTGSQLQKNTK